ncbi:MAG: HD domain-containing protein [Desulforhopalus sp.]|nr:HD domain-containing protein [Desulforhopalus sp.]
MMGKNLFVKELKEGDRFEDLFLIKNVKLGETRAGKPYLVLTVMDKSGEVSGPVWDNVLPLQKVCVAGEVVQLTGMVQSYRDALQLRIDGINQVSQAEIDLGHFYPASPRNIRQMADELQDLVQSISNPFLKKLLNHFFKKRDSWPDFQEAPAAKGIHHAYIGGLLEHSLSVARVADFLAKHYEGVDRSLLIAGALLHDIGKLEELKMEGGLVEYTVRGRLKGHLVIGSEMVALAAGEIRDFPEELLEQLQHLVLSHHGRQEFGSPAVPMTVEAFMLSFLDDLDAKMNITEQLRRKMDNKELSWTDYQRSLERYLYLGGFERKEPEGSVTQPNSSRQPSLF